MKKIFTFIFVLLFGITLVSCKGNNEEDPKYAIYKLAVEKGYTGSYEDWINELKGDKVVLTVIDDELKWKYSTEADTSYRLLIKLSTLKGKDGNDGIDGKDAKEIKDISSIKVGDTTIFTFTFDDDTEIKAELLEQKEVIKDIELETKEVNAYKVFKSLTDTEFYDIYLDKEEFQLGKYEFKFDPEKDLIPYVSLEQMAKIYNFNLKNENSISKVEEIDGSSVWTITTNNKLNSYVKVDPVNQEFTIIGSFEDVYKSAKDNTKNSLNFEIKTSSSVIYKPEGQTKTVLSYKDTEFVALKDDGVTYYPFGLMNLALENYTGHKYVYNYTNLYEYDEFDNLTKLEIYNKDGDEESYNVMSQMEKYVDSHYLEKDEYQNPLMPLYLRINNRSEFMFEFENFYGLAKTRHITSILDLFDNYGILDRMIDSNAAVRGKAYNEASFILEDLHTSKLNTSRTPWGEDNGKAGAIEPAQSSKFAEERRVLGRTLQEMRKNMFKNAGIEEDQAKDAILYSKDGLTAYFYFDSFDAATYAYKKDGTRKTDESLAKEDSYFFFVKKLTEIKNHTTTIDGKEVKVKNVIIDDSQNSGGYIYALGKILALISKDNNASLYIRNDLTTEISKTTFQVDSNKDNVFDEKDCFGNDFNFFILTSNQSFSCGNALPYLAANQFSHVTLIGERSGGGECVVGSCVLSNFSNYYHSSSDHLVIYDEKTKEVSGVEDGIAPRKTLLYSEFYNIEALNNVIKELTKQSIA